MFDYEKFENNLVQRMETVLDKWLNENDDIYIFSLDCSRGMESIGAIANTKHYLEEQTEDDSEDYWYYKYCEEEWELFDTFTEISEDMRQFLDDNGDVFVDPQTNEYTVVFEDEHMDKMTECCQNALIRFRQSINQKHPDILLTFNIREYLDEDERIEIFKKINSKTAAKEYSRHIEDFA